MGAGTCPSWHEQDSKDKWRIIARYCAIAAAAVSTVPCPALIVLPPSTYYEKKDPISSSRMSAVRRPVDALTIVDDMSFAFVSILLAALRVTGIDLACLKLSSDTRLLLSFGPLLVVDSFF